MTPIEKVRAALEMAKRKAATAISHGIYENALAELEGMAIVPIEPDKLPKGFTQLDYAELIAPYVSEEKK